MVKYKIQTFVFTRQGKVTIPATVRKMLNIRKNGECFRMVAEKGKIELIPIGTTVLPEITS